MKNKKMDILLERKQDLENALVNANSKLKWSHTDDYGTYTIEIITTHQVRIRVQPLGTTEEIVMESNVFEDMYEFYQKLKGDEE